MMILSSRRPDSSIVEYLEYRARNETIRGLVTRTLLAFALVIGAFGAMPVGKPIVVTLAFTYFCYGAWGLLDRARSYSRARGWTSAGVYLRWLCALFVALGVLSGIALIMSAGFILLGAPWIL